jgi:hypothetical protein
MLELSKREAATARYLGADAALAAATWLEMPEADAASILADVDPAVLDQYEPPNLSGEFAGDPTPDSLTLEVTSYALAEDRAEVADAVADAWEAGRDEVWSDALEAQALRVVGRTDAALYVEARLERLVSVLRDATREAGQ